MGRAECIVWIDRIWGREEVLVNSLKYCCKLLHVDQGAISELHTHPIKRETFYCLVGSVKVRAGNDIFILTPRASPVTIEPGESHSFQALSPRPILLEVSTHDMEEDAVFYDQGQQGTRKAMEQQL